MRLLMNGVVKQKQRNFIVLGPKSILQIVANSINLLVIIAGRKGTYKKCVNRKNVREKIVCLVDIMNGFKEEEYKTDQSVYTCHVSKREGTTKIYPLSVDDSALAFSTWLMELYSNAILTPEQRNLNYILSRARMVCRIWRKLELP